MAHILDQIDTHKDLMALDDADLKALADEVRSYIIECVAENGGHLASNLGTVELTVALLAELDPEVDRIVWDVGHQSYAMKILTGRRLAMKKLRQEGGPSGFPNIKESKSDCFGTGHSSTSISAALGLAVSRRLKGAGNAVVAVIGDGAMTGGMAYEAMNNAGALKEDLIVILNDNEQAIARNVGSISEMLERIRFSPARRKIENGFKQILSGIPIVGEKIRQAGHVVKRSLKGLLLPKMLFEDLGFTYIGPLDGHNIKMMRNAIRDARKLGGPVIIHAVTKKGKGYAPAEADPDSYHGTGPFDPATGIKVNNNKDGFTDVFSKKLVELAESDPRIVAITAAMPAGTGLSSFAKRFPGRYFDVGIAEQHAVTFAAGLAAGGLVPVVALYSTFLQRAYDQMLHDVALQGLHVVLAIDRAGIVGEDGATHQGTYDMSMALSAPGFTVLAPMDGTELEMMLGWAAEEAAGPVMIRYPKGHSNDSARTGPAAPFMPGRAEVLKSGSDVALICEGPSTSEAMKATSMLEDEGISATVINIRSLKPIDEQVVRSALKGHRLIFTVEEGVARGGLYSSVMLLCEGQAGSVIPLSIPESPIKHGKRPAVISRLGLDAEGIAKAVMAAAAKEGR